MEEEFIEDLRMKALGGDSHAQYELAQNYSVGNGCKRDMDKAMRWITKASRANNTMAMMYLARLLQKNDPKTALEWLHNAAEIGDAEAQAELALIYSGMKSILFRIRVPNDYEKAFYWASRSGGWSLLAHMYAEGIGVAQSDRMAFGYYQVGANNGNSFAMEKLIPYYLYGYGVEQDVEEAVRLMEHFANEGFIRYQYRLGMLYLNGRHVETSPQKAIHWLVMAAHAGNTKAMRTLAAAYASGEILPRDPALSFRYYSLVAQSSSNQPEAWTAMGDFYSEGAFVGLDLSEAAVWYLRAAKLKYVPAILKIAKFYEQGLGVERDQVRAHAWLQLSENYEVQEMRSKLEDQLDPQQLANSAELVLVILFEDI